MREIEIYYNDGITRRFVLASVFWGAIGMLVGVLIATQLAFFQANFNTSWLTFGRIRPLHTNAVIFAFVGNMLFGGIYYSLQRLLKTRIASDLLSSLHFWGWQLAIVGAAITLPLGYTQGKEYAELEWPIDLLIAVVWVIFTINFFWTIAIRREKHLYVAIWFYISTVVTVPVLFIVNNLAVPVGLSFKSYSIFAGVQDALIQWWYGHNAVAFFLTTPILGIMYYFVPKAAERPIYSYRLSIIHFWSLIFLYIWAGPHHLLNTALPEWAQSMGMIFSLMLWAPSWGGMINGLLTLRGAWDKLRKDPVLKFFAAAITFYGMATFEGPLLSIKSVSALAHYTDWVIGHVHSGALGWNGFMAAGMFYWLVPRLWGTRLYSVKMADVHFWLGTFGILLYMVSMWVSGVTQGLMWRATSPDGSLLYPSFVETVIAIWPMYLMRLIGGTLYFVGFLLMVFNLAKTILAGHATDVSVSVIDMKEEKAFPTKTKGFSGAVLLLLGIVASSIAFLFSDLLLAPVLLSVMAALVVAFVLYVDKERRSKEGNVHGLLEGKPLAFTWLVLVAILIGGLVELLPSLVSKPYDPKAVANKKPYTALELAGRDIYVKEGCYNCHSQMIRPLESELLRYGEPAQMEDSMFDHPFQWGSKRTGPDLQRVGGKYPNLWHYQHMLDPRATSLGSNMPAYPWLETNKLEAAELAQKLRIMKLFGVPYTDEQIDNAYADALSQAKGIQEDLAQQGVKVDSDVELLALIAYLQSLGKK